MKIGYISDLHLEFPQHCHRRYNTDGGNVLIIAGDFSTAQMFRSDRTDKDAKTFKRYLTGNFKNDVIDKYENIIYVMGNHEHYRSIFKNTKRTIQQGLSDLGLNKIWLCDNNMFKFSDCVIYGGTLWTDFNNNDDFTKYIVERGMNDYRQIGAIDVGDMNYFNRRHSTMITPEFILNEHYTTKQYITEISKYHIPTGSKKIVVTHMGPTWKSINPIHGHNALDPAFASNLEQLIFDLEIDYWIHGHTHHSCQYQVGPCTVLSNQQGYYMEQSFKDFSGIKHIEI